MILAIVGRAAAPERRSLTLGITTAAGSAGQLVGPPLAEALLGVMHWSSVFLVFAATVLAVLVVLPFIKEPVRVAQAGPSERMGAIVGNAVRDPSFILIFLGFFSCGYQLGFITAHFPPSSPRSARRFRRPACWPASASPARRRSGPSPSP